MYYNATMPASFEAEKNRKAFAYTAVICGTILLIAILVSWQLPTAPKPLFQDLIEINLGNEIEGSGTVQPLIKGEKAPSTAVAQQLQHAAATNNTVKEIPTEDNTDKDAAPVTKPVKTPVKVTTPAPVVTPEPKPQKPKIAGYSGPKNATGNGATEDKGYKYQGNNPGGKGDAGNPNGKPDSYGNTPGGKSGGSLRVSKGDRTIVNNYIFAGVLPKAIINAINKVSPDGRGTFVSLDRGSTTSGSEYVSAIRDYLPKIQFSKADHESIVTVPFNFTVR